MTYKTELAHRIALEAFRNKVDKAGNPYIEHCKQVAVTAPLFYVEKLMLSGRLCVQESPEEESYEKLFVCGMLHDLIEDCPEKFSEMQLEVLFGKEIVEILKMLTKIKKMDYGYYIQRISECKYATAVKLADLRHNMDLTRFSAKNPPSENDFRRIKERYLPAYEKLKGENSFPIGIESSFAGLKIKL